MPHNHAAENILGTIGTVLWTGQLIPQIWKSWREKSTEGLSTTLMYGAPATGVYNIVQHINIPLIIQPQLFGALAALSWTQCLHYSRKLSTRLCTAIYISYLIVFAAFESGMTYVTSTSIHGQEFLRFFGVFSVVLIVIGLIPQYIEIWRLGEVIGISMVFMALDIAGGVFSLLSLVFRRQFDAVASATYICVIVMDGIVVICALVLNPRSRRRRREAALRASTPSTITTTISASAEGASRARETGSGMTIRIPEKKSEDVASHTSHSQEEAPSDIDVERGAGIKAYRGRKYGVVSEWRWPCG
ncbi:hypothetical protein BS47DRAFT_1417660 [Hydnum rufescens UP504]|uniref:PQ loop repeat protein n=1 Tax=Hydnum rufescens UP504 TaxID=1448309 RepID=A0A9P6ALZ0_9AGAM|nr:hypothetical protein BS47DRAFT_1417660 [Hydnum rufescens UP504]